jgi:hypothetical protein
MHMYVTNNEVDHFEVHICREMTNYTYFCVSKRSVLVSGMGQNEQSDAEQSGSTKLFYMFVVALYH